MNAPLLKKVSPERFASFAAGIFAAFISTAMLLSAYQPGSGTPFELLLPCLLWLCGTGAIFGCCLSIMILLREGRNNVQGLLHLSIFALSFLLFSVQLIVMTQALSLWICYGIYSLLLLAMVIVLNDQQSRLLGSPYPERASMALILGLLNLGFATWEFRHLRFQGLEEPALECARTTYLLILIQPILVICIRGMSSRKSDIQGRVQTRRRIKSFIKRHPEKLRYYIANWLFCAAAALICQWLLNEYSPENPASPWLGSKILWGCLGLSWIPALLHQYRIWQLAQNFPRIFRNQPMLTGGRAEDFLTKHHLPRDAKETWLGLRTAIIMIDHDPHEECRVHLPALLYRARQVQCEQIMSRIFSDQILSTQSHGSQLLASLDPEHSITSCTESLLILTVLYLDGLPLVEKRLKQLVRLLPLLDPDLGRILSEHKVEQLFSRLHGFFHLDYNWIDQTMRSGIDEASFDVRLENLNPKERHRVLTQLSSAQWLGNFIWISESARDRLKAESPFLSSAVERWPIQLEQTHGKPLETAVFLIKFENLIPRLQRYHDLDLTRNRLAPLALAPETDKLCEKAATILSQELDHIDLQNLLQEMQEHEWKGFRAKDMALEILLKMVTRADQLEKIARIGQTEWQNFRRDTKDLVQKIGYPSQELHNAHLSKMELRELHELQRICLEPGHPRCREAWLLLASLPTRNITIDSAAQLLQSIASACQLPLLRRHEIILHKAVEAFFHLARVLPANRDHEVQRVFDILARTLIHVEAEQELLLAFMDGKLAMDQQRGNELPISSSTLKIWKETIDTLLLESDQSATTQSAIDIRWRSFVGGNSLDHRAVS